MKITGYKGFNPNLQCNPTGRTPFQFEIGRTYKEEDSILCESGFHFCENPLAVFRYYAPTGRFAVVRASGNIVGNSDKSCCQEIEIVKELSLSELVQEGVNFAIKNGKIEIGGYATGDRGAASATVDRGAASATGFRGSASATGDRAAASATGDRGSASATGYHGAAFATGDRAAASATGYRGAAAATGKQSIAHADGPHTSAMGSLGNWITCSEWTQDETGKLVRSCVKAVKVDGKRIKAGVFYRLKNKKFVEVQA